MIAAAAVMTRAVAAMIDRPPRLVGAGGVYAQMPWMIPVVIVLGVVYAHWLRMKRPQTYAILGQLSVNEDLDRNIADSSPTLASPAETVQGGGQ